MLKRIVQERVRRSNKRNKFSLEDDEEEGGLTHRGQAIDASYTGAPIDTADIPLSDDDNNGEDLDKVDTMLHFGGGKFDKANRAERGAYGGDNGDMGQQYRSRREELEDTIRRKKMEKAEKMKRKEDQAETFENMDTSFAELAHLLNFRDKEDERVKTTQARKKGLLSTDEMEMDAWDREMKEYLFERRVKATNRTKTPEEIAKNEADRLHALESKRLARMAGDFLSEDEFSDVSDDENENKRKRRKGNEKTKPKTKKREYTNPEEMSDSDDDDKEKEEKLQVQFTADGLMYVDKHGKFVGKVGEEDKKKGDDQEDAEVEDSEEESDGNDSEGSDDSFAAENDLGGSDDEASAATNDSEEDDNDDDDNTHFVELKKGMAVQGNYHATEQYGDKKTWYNGIITAIHEDTRGNTSYDVTYDDGDFEDGILAENVRPVPKSVEQKKEEERVKTAKLTEAAMEKKKKIKAKIRAKEAIPFVFEVPTTLDALHDIIAQHASTGAHASLIIQRIHATNSVRLNHKNKNAMQNFYDVLLRRFVAVGDAIFSSGNGGPDLERYEQLNSIIKTLYVMSRDSPECAGAVWSRRMGIFQKGEP